MMMYWHLLNAWILYRISRLIVTGAVLAFMLFILYFMTCIFLWRMRAQAAFRRTYLPKGR